MEIESKFIIHNNEIIKKSDFSLTLNNRSFRYGDALFETMHANATRVQFIDDHLKRLLESAAIIKFEVPSFLTKKTLAEKIHKLLDKNKLYMGSRLRLSLYRNDGGLYTPEDNKTSVLIEAAPLKENKYVLNKSGLQINLFRDITKPLNKLSNLKTANALIYVLAGIYKKESKSDDCIIVNDKGNIAEFISSNLFLVKNKTIITPALNEGCVDGVMRKQIIRIAKKLDYDMRETELKLNFLAEADEIFMTNAINGIKWVGGYKKKRYFNRVSDQLISELNKVAFEDE